MRQRLQINLFSQFNLARNLKDQCSFSCSRWRACVRLPVVNAPQPGLQPDVFSSMLNRDEIGYSNLSSVSQITIYKPISSRHKHSQGGHISVCRHVTLKHNSFWRYKPVMISKRYPKFKELKIMLTTETSSLHFHGASDLQYVLFLLLRVFFIICNLVYDPK